MGREDIDDEAIWILDRFYAGTMKGMAWPLAGHAPGEPMGAVLAWLRAGARDPRCLWWVVERFGTAELLDALDEMRDRIHWALVDPAYSWAVTWLRGVATEAWEFENGADGRPVLSFQVHPTGARIWEAKG